MATTDFPILPYTVTATGAISASRFVTPAGAQAGADANTLGIARTAASAGDTIAVDVLGIVTAEAGAAVSAGSTIKSDSSGRAITWATSGAKVGVALSSASAAGDMITVLLIPNAA